MDFEPTTYTLLSGGIPFLIFAHGQHLPMCLLKILRSDSVSESPSAFRWDTYNVSPGFRWKCSSRRSRCFPNLKPSKRHYTCTWVPSLPPDSWTLGGKAAVKKLDSAGQMPCLVLLSLIDRVRAQGVVSTTLCRIESVRMRCTGMLTLNTD